MHAHSHCEVGLTLTTKHQELSESGLAANKGFACLFSVFSGTKTLLGGKKWVYSTQNAKTSDLKAPGSRRVLWHHFEVVGVVLVASVSSSLSSPVCLPSLLPSATELGCEYFQTYTWHCVGWSFIGVKVIFHRIPRPFLQHGIHIPSRCGPKSPLAFVFWHPAASREEFSLWGELGLGLPSILPVVLHLSHWGHGMLLLLLVSWSLTDSSVPSLLSIIPSICTSLTNQKPKVMFPFSCHLRLSQLRLML